MHKHVRKCSSVSFPSTATRANQQLGVKMHAASSTVSAGAKSVRGHIAYHFSVLEVKTSLADPDRGCAVRIAEQKDQGTFWG
jgi:hypothetical protein